MTRAPLLRLGGVDDGSCLTVLGVDVDDHDADLADADPEDANLEETDAIRGGGTTSAAVAVASRGPASCRSR
jgi:hypothetical protein